MAEFKEVIRQANRLCKCKQGDYCSNRCPLHIDNNGRDIICTTLKSDYPEEYEAIVMKWAEEHPVMTNNQKLIEVLTDAFGENIAIDFTKRREGCSGFYCKAKECTECEYNNFWNKEYQP